MFRKQAAIIIILGKLRMKLGSDPHDCFLNNFIYQFYNFNYLYISVLDG